MHLDLRSDAVLAQILDRGSLEDWRAIYAMAERDPPRAHRGAPLSRADRVSLDVARRASRAPGPPVRYRRTHSLTVLTLSLNALAIPVIVAPPSTTCSTTRRRNSGECGCPRPPAAAIDLAVAACFDPVRFFFGITALL